MATSIMARAVAPSSPDLPPAGYPSLKDFGPHDDSGDLDTVRLSGCGRILLALGIERPEGMIEREHPVTLTDAAGTIWEYWGDWAGGALQRPRTRAEREEWVDKQNRRFTHEWFSKDRQFIVRMIAIEMQDIALKLADRPKRGQRADFSFKLSMLGEAQWALTTRHDVDMPMIREMLADAGLEVAQPNYLSEFH